MNEWKEYKLGEVVAFGNGKVRPAIKGEIPVYGGNGILDYCSTHNYLDETVIIGRVGAYCGSVYYENKPIWVSDNALAAKPKNGYNAKFLYYYLTNLRLNEFAEGSSHPLVTQTLLNSIDVRITNNIEEQKRIAGILSSLDDKIDLLTRQNRTLEAMAETLFRHHFIDNPKIDWKEKCLGDFILETVGGEWGKEIFETDFTKAVQCIRGTDIADLNIGLANKTPIRFIKTDKFNKIEPQEGDLILEISGGTENQSTGRVTYINNNVKALFSYPLIFSNFCRLLRIKNKDYSYYLYCYIQYLYNQDEFFNLENGSSGIKNLDYKSLLFNLKYTMPSNDNEIISFGKTVEIYFEKINKNKLQIRNLTKLRDTLLPKLMNNDIRVDG